jgi:hypothetical protein
MKKEIDSIKKVIKSFGIGFSNGGWRIELKEGMI